MLAAPPLRIQQDLHRLSERSRFNGPLAVMHVPRFEQLDNPATMRIVRLYFVNPVDGIATAKRQERIAAPFGPLFETAEWPTVHEICRFCRAQRQMVKAAASSSARWRSIWSSNPGPGDGRPSAPIPSIARASTSCWQFEHRSRD